MWGEGQEIRGLFQQWRRTDKSCLNLLNLFSSVVFHNANPNLLEEQKGTVKKQFEQVFPTNFFFVTFSWQYDCFQGNFLTMSKRKVIQNWVQLSKSSRGVHLSLDLVRSVAQSPPPMQRGQSVYNNCRSPVLTMDGKRTIAKEGQPECVRPKKTGNPEEPLRDLLLGTRPCWHSCQVKANTTNASHLTATLQVMLSAPHVRRENKVSNKKIFFFRMSDHTITDETVLPWNDFPPVRLLTCSWTRMARLRAGVGVGVQTFSVITHACALNWKAWLYCVRFVRCRDVENVRHKT